MADLQAEAADRRRLRGDALPERRPRGAFIRTPMARVVLVAGRAVMALADALDGSVTRAATGPDRG